MTKDLTALLRNGVAHAGDLRIESPDNGIGFEIEVRDLNNKVKDAELGKFVADAINEKYLRELKDQ